MLGGVHDIRECPRSVRNERVDRTDALDRDNGLGGHLNRSKDLRGIKVDSDSRKVFDGADYDRISRGHKESRRAIETDTQCQENGPRGHLGEKVERDISRAIERDRRRQNVVEGDEYDPTGRGCVTPEKLATKTPVMRYF